MAAGRSRNRCAKNKSATGIMSMQSSAESLLRHPFRIFTGAARLANAFRRVLALFAVSFLPAFTVSGAALADNVGGAWLSPSANNWPLIAVHAALTPDGRVLTYGTDGSGTQTGFFIYDIWDPAQGCPTGTSRCPI
jgi:hypothetical protein